MKQRDPQMKMLANQPKAYGGELLKTREGRSMGRPLDTRHSMHLVLRSSKAVGNWSFFKTNNRVVINKIVAKFAQRYGVQILSMANVGNHLHFHLKLSNRYTYRGFIRAVTGSIAMAVTGVSRWKKQKTKLQFWDYRPFTRIALGFKSFLILRDYVELNRLEGFGLKRPQAQFFMKWSPLKTMADSG